MKLDAHIGAVCRLSRSALKNPIRSRSFAWQNSPLLAQFMILTRARDLADDGEAAAGHIIVNNVILVVVALTALGLGTLLGP
jgi:hypothetical protein